MKRIKSTTKKGYKMMHDYLGAQFTELYQIYGRYSNLKEEALYICKTICSQENGERFRIISWNGFQFTCGWTTKEHNIRIETRYNSYLIEV